MIRPSSPGGDELLGRYFPVLDHGFIALVDYMGTDHCIERAARTSYGQGARAVHETRGLIRYLRRHLHTTPSEMLELKFHCAMPIFVARQWIRHRTASVNEMSGRYALLPMQFYTPEREQFRTQSTTNRQGRSDKVAGLDEYERATLGWHQGRSDAQAQYEWLIAHDVANELARIDLPLSTYTQWYWKVDLHNLLHFLKLRVDPHAQFEVRVYGEIIAAMLARIAPISYEAWIDYDLAGARLSRMEMEVIRDLLEANSERVRCVFVDREDQNIPRARLESDFGLTSREIDELIQKLAPRETPKFELNLEDSKPPEHFEALQLAAVPKKA